MCVVRALKRCDAAVLISRRGKDVLTARVPGLDRKSHLTHWGASPEWARAGAAQAAPIPGPYLLYVSPLDFYKHQLEVVDAFAAIRADLAPGARLVLIGHEYPAYARQVRQRIACLGLGDAVLLPGPVPHDSLPAWYRHAAAALFSSTVEFCPNVVLEMLACGCAMGLSRLEPMPELAGDAAIYYDPCSAADTARAARALCTDTGLARTLTQRARLRAESFTWSHTAARFHEALHAAIRSRNLDQPTSRTA
jgi:glycosyltransferase involved in cell wall biosynthesis